MKVGEEEACDSIGRDLFSQQAADGTWAAVEEENFIVERDEVAGAGAVPERRRCAGAEESEGERQVGLSSN